MNPENQNMNPQPQSAAVPSPAVPPASPAQTATSQPSQPMPQMQTAAPAPAPEPAASNQPFFGFGTANPGVEPVPAPAPTPANPTSVLSPTHFDNLRFEQQAASGQQPEPAKAPEDPQKTIKKFMILSISLGIAAVVFLIVGIVGIINIVNMKDELADITKQKSSLETIISAIEEQTNATINTIEDIPIYQPASDFIYLTEWGIKLQIPDTLTSVSYILDQNADYRPSVCFNAIKSGVQYFPAFADVKQNPGGMGCLQRVSIEDGEKDSSGNSFGQIVYTSEDYNYFYQAPKKVYSASDAEKALEATAVQLIKTMITDNISEYQ